MFTKITLSAKVLNSTIFIILNASTNTNLNCAPTKMGCKDTFSFNLNNS